MKRSCRLLLALVALAASTAFAPAPFPRPERRGDPNVISLQAFQGTWKAVSFDGIGPNDTRQNLGLWFQHVRVRGDRWIYVVNDAEGLSYRIAVAGDRRPAQIDYSEIQGSPEQVVMCGIMRREGNRITVLYYATPPQNRPKSFENMPQNWWLLVLERQ